ncbi:MAG TPA: alpha/beta fold hydrolase [Burkholderiales bacterium]|nr:alpha/beta fold hydrolase [Burkholderiales bacterium]
MTSAQDAVVLVHGLWVHGLAMELMRRRIARCGYRALAYSYPSMRLTMTENVERLVRYCRELATPRVNFVGHSMGGLIALHALENASGFTPGRAVLTGTPVTGCHAARRLARLPGGRAALGRCMPGWMESAACTAGHGREVGVIAGRMPLGIGRIVAPDLQRPCDGVVSVAETRFPAMRDHIVLNVSHTGILFSRAVARQICAFLRNGAFDKAEGGSRKAEG